MTLERVRRWIQALPLQEYDMPYLKIEGRMLTPRQILSEVQQGTQTGMLAQNAIEAGIVLNDQGLIETRIEKWLSRYAPDEPLFLTLWREKQLLTPREIFEEVRKDTNIGKTVKKTEAKYLQYLAKLGS